MDILISFCNTWKTPGYPSLGLLNSDDMELMIVDLPVEVPKTGMMGLAKSEKYIFMGCHQYTDGILIVSAPILFIFDSIEFKLINRYEFKFVVDVHSLLLSEDEKVMYVISSGTDEVIKLHLNESEVVSEEVFWRPEKDAVRSDNYHLNSIQWYKENIYVSGFGKRTVEGDWNSANDGFIQNINNNQIVISGLQHPHSILNVEDQWLFCESRKKLVRFQDSKRPKVELSSYTRGICMVENKLFVGTSARRSKSKSTGKFLPHVDSNNSECSITRIEARTFEVEYKLSLKDYANEIYELLPVENTYKWPVHKPINYRLEYERTWQYKLDVALEEIKSVIPVGQRIIIVDDNNWGDLQQLLPKHKSLYFLENDGIYWGMPEDDNTAIKELNRLQKYENVNYIVFGWPSFWWFDYYIEFYKYIRTNSVSLFENELIAIFDLKNQK